MVVAVVVAAFAIAWLVPGGSEYPASGVIPFADWLNAIMRWIKVTFTWATRGLADLINIPLKLAIGFLAKGYRINWGESFITLPRFSWVGCVPSRASSATALAASSSDC